MDGKALNGLSKSVRDAINQLTMWVKLAFTYHVLDRRTVAEIQEEVSKRSRCHRFSLFLRSEGDKDAITAWKLSFNKILHLFNVCPVHSGRFSFANYSVSRPSWL